jgi:hypothetical protein
MRVTGVILQQMLSKVFVFNEKIALNAYNKFHFTDLKTNLHVVQKAVLTQERKRERELAIQNSFIVFKYTNICVHSNNIPHYC